jgi:TRAP-type mannitol/chloroaromatic compound transport system permease small subunit
VNYWATFAQTINRTNQSIGKSVAFASIAMALVTTSVVILRYGFEQGAIAAQESVLYLHGALFMLGGRTHLIGR